MLRQFVLWTGAFAFVFGGGVWARAISDPQPGHFTTQMALGAFLMMAAACLMWASKDIYYRAPVVFWEGLVRLVACASILFAVSQDLAARWEYAVAVFDGLVGIVYIVGVRHVTGLSLVRLMRCDDPDAASEPAKDMAGPD